MWWGRLVLTICKVHLCTPFILTSLLARLVIANLHWFIPAIYSPQGTEVIHPWKNLSYSPFFSSHASIYVVIEGWSFCLRCVLHRSQCLQSQVQQKNMALPIAGMVTWRLQWEKKAEVLKPSSTLIWTGTSSSLTPLGTNLAWKKAVLEPSRDLEVKLDKLR